MSEARDKGGERPTAEHEGGAIWWHSQTRYLFACELARGARVLDVACGHGFGTVRLAEVAATVAGADVSPEAVEIARRVNPRPNVRYETVAKPPFPFADASFALVVCLETIEHMHAHEQPAFVAELTRLLAPDGILVLSTPDRASEQSLASMTGEPNPYHLHTPSGEELDRLLAAFPHRVELVQMDYVATTVVPVAREARLAKLAAPNAALDEQTSQPFPVAVFRVCARTPVGLARVEAARAPVAFRADYQRLSYLAQALHASRLPDLSGLPLVEQLGVIVERVEKIVGNADGRIAKLEDQTRDLWLNVDRLNRNLSVRGILDRLRGRRS
jgi:SAM-dependent methyltransferase